MNYQRPLLLWLFVVILLGWSSRTTAAERPNFLWLVSEDNSKHYLKLFDPHGAPTPNIAALAKEGAIFDHAFSRSTRDQEPC